MKTLKQDIRGFSFIELLLDETICKGMIAIPLQLVKQVGGLNWRLKAKNKYELILRIAKMGKVLITEDNAKLQKSEYIFLQDDEKEKDCLDSIKTDCYIIGKYSNDLKQSGYFDAAVNSVLQEAEQNGQLQQSIVFLEEMVGHGKRFCQLEHGECPVLIYKGDSVCHNILTVMAVQLGSALEQKGIPVIYFDCEKEGLEGIIPYMYKQFQAIIGIQSYMFSIKLKDSEHYLHEYIYGPKYNFIFDHPIFLHEHLQNRISEYYILAHDINYIYFIQKHYGGNAVLLPPAGMLIDTNQVLEKTYDITFVGTYGDYREEIRFIHQLERKIRFLANHFLMLMKRNPKWTAEEAFDQVLTKRKIVLTHKDYLNIFYELRRVICCVMHYYREKVIEVILDSGLQVDVFGDSWLQCPLRKKYNNLICHSNVTIEEGVMIWGKSKFSLNVMSWHKAGFTERMAGIMLAGAVLVTDDTSYLKKKYNQSEMLIFHLESLEDIPKRIQYLLSNEKERRIMAENGRKKTLQEHTWMKRAEQLIDLIERDYGT